MTQFTRHAETMLLERGIAREWAERVLTSPGWEELDPSNPGQKRAFAAIAEAGGKILRVVYTVQAGEKRVITLFFDRRAKKPGASS